MFAIRLGLGLLLIGAGVARPAPAVVFEEFVYGVVGAYGPNNEYDVSPQACDFERGCFTADGTLCAENPNQTCRLAIIPKGRCAAGEANTLWPRFAGQCEGTL
ncbi:MAG: hypothetical protein ACE5FG_11915, partial [Myxococcota bacterium]